ncbi:hypothetical protein ACWTU8_11415 [Mesorhizobium sp. BHbdii]
MSKAVSLVPAQNKTFIEAQQNVRSWRYLLVSIDETDGDIPRPFSAES